MAEAELCSRVSARQGVALIGSAGSHDAILAFELVPPWTPRLTGSRGGSGELDAALDAIGALGAHVRVLALEPADRAKDGKSRILWFARDGEGFHSYSRKEYRVLPETLPAVLYQLAETGATPADEHEGGREGRDLLVCTHGSRDACCGRFGYPLFRRLAERAAARPDPVRVWRCSHLGGHRFAPTLLDLPSGRMFGRIGDDDADAILSGGPALLERVPAIYRGRSALPEAAQIVERALWMDVGPALDAATLRWNVEGGGPRWRVRVEACGVDGGRSEAVALVERSGAMAVSSPASCGRDPEPEVPWRIVG